MRFIRVLNLRSDFIPVLQVNEDVYSASALMFWDVFRDVRCDRCRSVGKLLYKPQSLGFV